MIAAIKETYRDFIDFIKVPKDEQSPLQTKSHQAKRLFSLLAIDIPVMGVLMVIISSLSNIGLINLDDNEVSKLMEQSPKWLFLGLAVILIPFIEEVIFRLYLRFRQNYLIRFLILLSSITGKEWKIKTEYSLRRVWNTNYRFIFYFSAILFGLIHLSNYELSGTSIYLIPVLILPQVIAGLFIGYLRVRYNFLLGFLIHVLHNAFFVIIGLYSLNNSDEKLNIETDTYSLKIEEVANSKKIYAAFSEDSISFHGENLKSILAALLKEDENLMESNNSKRANQQLNLLFKNTSKKKLERSPLIIEHLTEVYDFKIEYSKRNRKVYDIHIQDSLKLMEHVSNLGHNSSTTTGSFSKITLGNLTLNEIAQSLTRTHSLYIENNTSNDNRFTLIFPNRGFEKIRTILEEDYGIVLDETEKELDYIYINFRE